MCSYASNDWWKKKRNYVIELLIYNLLKECVYYETNINLVKSDFEDFISWILAYTLLWKNITMIKHIFIN